jgi:D-alanyl-D-alanine dipeptidase
MLKIFVLALSLYSSPSDSMKFLLNNPDFVQATKIPGVSAELKYATIDNFTRKNLYGDFQTCFLHKVAAEKLKKAVELLREKNPKYSFLIYDGLRPRSVQRVMWAQVEGSNSQKYVANPKRGSMHNYGLAIDLTVTDENGKPLDMGAGFDDFRELSQPKFEKRFLKSGELTPAQVANRKLLRNAMEKAGFIQLPHEWWHFDALPQGQAEKTFTIVE